MKKRNSLGAAFALIALASLGACAGSLARTAAAPLTAGPRFCLELSPGPSYRTTTRWLIFSLPIYPQVAAWVETPDGRYLGTIFATNKGYKGSYQAAPKEGRPEALPVWTHLRQAGIDGVSSATSAGDTTAASGLAAKLPPGDYVIKLEANRSYDYNEAYPQARAGVCGQPSIVYRAVLRLGSGQARAVFTPIGTGSLDGRDGDIHGDLEGISTALELFSRMRVSYLE